MSLPLNEANEQTSSRAQNFYVGVTDIFWKARDANAYFLRSRRRGALALGRQRAARIFGRQRTH
jgi:hypothetical protein